MNELSPAAQAIVSAFNERYEVCGLFDRNWDELCLAAALRSLADQGEKLFDRHTGTVSVVRIDRIEALIAELESHDG